MHRIVPVLIGLLGLLQMAASAYAFYVSTSPIHELLAAILSGFGTLCIALAIAARGLLRLHRAALLHLIRLDRLSERLGQLHETAQHQLAIFDRLGKARDPQQ